MAVPGMCILGVNPPQGRAKRLDHEEKYGSIGRLRQGGVQQKKGHKQEFIPHLAFYSNQIIQRLD